jgi:hypothetical protein
MASSVVRFPWERTEDIIPDRIGDGVMVGGVGSLSLAAYRQAAGCSGGLTAGRPACKISGK